MPIGLLCLCTTIALSRARSEGRPCFHDPFDVRPQRVLRVLHAACPVPVGRIDAAYWMASPARGQMTASGYRVFSMHTYSLYLLALWLVERSTAFLATSNSTVRRSTMRSKSAIRLSACWSRVWLPTNTAAVRVTNSVFPREHVRHDLVLAAHAGGALLRLPALTPPRPVSP